MIFSLPQGPQTEVSHRILENGGIEKRAQVSILCNVSYFDEPHAELRPVAISGVAVSLRAKGARAVASLKKSKFGPVGSIRWGFGNLNKIRLPHKTQNENL